MSNTSPASGYERIAILGAGAWGGTLASIYGCSGKHVSLWDRNAIKLEHLAQKKARAWPGSNAQVGGLSQVTVSTSVAGPTSELELAQAIALLTICTSLEEATIDATLVIFTVTSQSLRQVAEQLAKVFKPRADKNIVLISAVKGLELGSSKTMSQVISECMPGYPVAALSGPNFASEILKGYPAASVIACCNGDLAQHLQPSLSTESFRVYASTDVIGVELGGALKNIIAIAAGCADGMGLGSNARAAIVTRGLAEMGRLAAALGAQTETLSGLSGMGDLITTCTSSLSRNYQLGSLLAQGQSTNNALKHLIGTAEGVPTCDTACSLAQKLKIELPIAQQVQLLLQGSIAPAEAVMNLMQRPLARE